MRFDLADLRLFLAVVDAGSITWGASGANLSLAAASERLRDMEAAGGVRLLTRERRGVAPTRAGEALAHHARLVLRQVAEMQAELSEHARGFRGSVRCLANTAAISEFLPAPLALWLAAHPRIDVDLDERPSADIVRALAGGLAEIGIVSDAVETGTLDAVPFALDRLVAVMARDHALGRMRRIELRQILGEDRIAFSGALQTHVDEQARRIGQATRPRLVLRSLDAVCRAAAEGAGVGVVPETAARRFRPAARLARVPLADAWATRRLLLCCADRERLAPSARSLFEHLRDHAPCANGVSTERRIERLPFREAAPRPKTRQL